MKKTILTLSIAGILFSGYLSGVKLFSQTCAFNETCPYFLGYPACYFGFIMFAVITLVAAWRVFGKVNEKLALTALLTVSFMGILFAGYFTLGEIPLLLEQGFSSYVFGLPTCALGLIFYLLIFAFSLQDYRTEKKLRKATA
jgi:hypothetical protein